MSGELVSMLGITGMSNASTEPYYDDVDIGVGSRIAEVIMHYSRIIVWLIGTFGNIMSFLVFSRDTKSGSMSVFLFRYLAVFDFLVVQDYIQGIFRYVGIDLFDQFDWSCKIVFWIFHSSQMISVWILVSIGFERMIGVLWPHKAKILCTMKRGKIILIVIVCTSVLINSLQTLTLVSEPLYDSTLQRVLLICNYRPTPGSFLEMYVQLVRPWVVLAIYNGIPFVLILCVNITIISALIRNRHIAKVNIEF